ncbi:hypothetical protein pb186bvf_017158 [Paramecium bursaria]
MSSYLVMHNLFVLNMKKIFIIDEYLNFIFQHPSKYSISIDGLDQKYILYTSLIVSLMSIINFIFFQFYKFKLKYSKLQCRHLKNLSQISVVRYL